MNQVLVAHPPTIDSTFTHPHQLQQPQIPIQHHVQLPAVIPNSEQQQKPPPSKATVKNVLQFLSIPLDEINRPVFVESLIFTAASLVESIWPTPQQQQHQPQQMCPMVPAAMASMTPTADHPTVMACPLQPTLKPVKLAPLTRVIQELVRRSRTSCSTLQLALYYLIRLRNVLSTTPPPTTTSSPLYCGRRMFLASLILANKFLQDKNYTNKAWAKISGLAAVDLASYQKDMLHALDWNLYVSQRTWMNWTRAVHKRAALVRQHWETERGLTLAREQKSRDIVGSWLKNLESPPLSSIPTIPTTPQDPSSLPSVTIPASLSSFGTFGSTPIHFILTPPQTTITHQNLKRPFATLTTDSGLPSPVSIDLALESSKRSRRA